MSPSPNPIRDKVLKGLKHSFPHKFDLVVGDTTYKYEDVKAALRVLLENGPDFFRVLHMFMFTPLSRAMLSSELNMDPSTVKRRLDRCADVIMQYLHHKDLGPPDLYVIMKILDGTTADGKHYATLVPDGKAPFPVVYPLADRSNY